MYAIQQSGLFRPKKDEKKIGASIFTLAEATGLPVNHHTEFQYDYTVTAANRLNIKKTLLSDKFNWYLLSKALMDELEEMAWPYIFGQGVLVRDIAGRTAVMSIAEAATVHLRDVAGLLECLLFIVDTGRQSFQTEGAIKGYKIKRGYLGPKKQQVTVKTLILPGSGCWVFGLQARGLGRVGAEQDILQALSWLQFILHSRSKLRQDDTSGLTIVRPFGMVNRVAQRVTIEESMLRKLKLGLETLRIEAEELVTDVSDTRRMEQTDDSNSCWRDKIVSAMVLEHGWLDLFPTRPPTGDFVPPKDALFLTAGALWSLFDDDLERKCSCTFRHIIKRGPAAKSGTEATDKAKDYAVLKEEWLQFKGKHDEWHVWHLERDANALCNGRNCSDKLDGKLLSTTPCVLGWYAETRSTIQEGKGTSFRPQNIAAYTALSSEFHNANARTFVPERLTLSAQLGVAFNGVSASIGAATSWMFKGSVVGNASEDLTELLSLNILLYCETRRLHLVMTAADLVEELCIHQLNQRRVDNIATFRPNHTALQRLKTWQATTFRRPDGTAIFGRELVRKASHRLQEYYDKRMPQPDNAPACWPLTVFLNGTESMAKRLPNPLPQTLLYLWQAYPILIFAVRQIDRRLVTKQEGEVGGTRYKDGGWVADQSHVENLLREATTLYPASIKIRPGSRVSVRGVSGTHRPFEISHREPVEQPNLTARCEGCAVGVAPGDGLPGDVCMHYFC